MRVTPSVLKEAKRRAEENYPTWGNYVVEAYTDEELTAELADHRSLSDWVTTRRRVASVFEERRHNY